MNLAELEKIVGKENVVQEYHILSSFATDNSLVPSRQPVGVVKPLNTSELKSVVKWANNEKVPLVPVSSGEPRFRGDTVPSVDNAVIVDLSRMNQIIRINTPNRVALVEPGVTFGVLQAELAKAGLSAYLPLLPRSSKSVLTSALERDPITMPCVHFDSTDPMLCAEIVYGSGESARTGEAAGPDSLEEQWKVGKAQISPFGPTQMDPQRLVAGAQGTMGIVTWISMKCRFLSEISRSFFIASESLSRLIELSYKLTKIRFTGNIFIVNGLNLMCLNHLSDTDILTNAEQTQPWIMFVSCEGYGPLPEEKVDYLEADLWEMARSYQLEPVKNIGNVDADVFSNLLSMPSPEPYWKQRLKKGIVELFFLTTQYKVAEFTALLNELATRRNYPKENIGIYFQPVVMGTSCHCEFDFYYDPDNSKEVELTRSFIVEVADAMEANGAFLNRPFAPWTEIAYRRYNDTKIMQKRVKDIFDPNGILNPGHLCFG